MREVRYAIRVLLRSPGFAAVAILSLALGIGANTAIYTVSWVLFSEPLPVANPADLYAVANQLTIPRGGPGMWQINGTSYSDPATGRGYRANLTYPAYAAIRSAAAGSADVFGYSFIREANISVGGIATTGAGALVSGNYFHASGAAIVLGRPLTEDDDRPGASAAVISHRLWTSAFGAAAAALGKVIRVNGVPFTIVGVSGPGFLGMSRGGFFPPMDVSIPLHAQPAVAGDWGPPGSSLFTSDRVFWVHAMARIKKGTPLEPLDVKLGAVFAQSLRASANPSYRRATNVSVRLLSGGRGVDELSGAVKQPLQILAVVVGIVLLVACVNLANLMLARGAAQRKEMSIRLALGSGRWRLMRQVVIESALLSLVGGAVGLLIGTAGGSALLRILTASAGPIALAVAPDWRMLATTAAFATAAAIISSLLPAVRLLRADVGPGLKTATAAGIGAPRLAIGRLLMIAQIAASVPLVAGAVILLRSIGNLDRVNPGFDAARLVSFRIDPALNGYDRARVEQTYARILDRARAVPGVTSASMLSEPLLAGISSNTSVRRDDGSVMDLFFNRVSAGFFETLGVSIVAGRAIEPADGLNAPPVVVLNESGARELFRGGPALGRHFLLFGEDVQVVGIVRDTKYSSVRKAAPPTVFQPYAQATKFAPRAMYVIARTSVAPIAVLGSLRAAAEDADRDVPVSHLTTEQQQIDDTLGTEVALTRLLMLFGAFALFLACIGLHGVTAYSVARRTSEIGVRVALGAQRGDVLWLILRQVVVVTVAGLAIGIPVAVASGRAVAAYLFGVAPADPISLIAAALLMTIIAVFAGYVPARRAARLDPLQALRID